MYISTETQEQTENRLKKVIQTADLKIFDSEYYLWIILTLASAIFPYHANSQSNAASATRDTLNIGYGVYTKGATPGTLNAIWNYANVWSGKGKATGVSKE